MKFIVYKEQKKITVDNVSIPDIGVLNMLLDEASKQEMSMDDLKLYNFRITATKGLISIKEEKENEELEKEIEEGINWYQETVN